MKRTGFDTFLKALYAVGFVCVLGMLVTGLPYYLLPLGERPHSGMHDQLKPAGIWGHGMGVVGSAMILLLLLYSVRKRGLMGIRFGRLRRWLDVHILFGVMGPLLITLHTAMKFHGIVSISYYSMLAVAFSGVFGRYIYMQIPRDARGHALGLEKAQGRISEIKQSLSDYHGLTAETAQVLEEFAAPPTRSSKIRGIAASIRQDLTLNRRARRLRRRLSRGGSSVPRETIDEVVDLARESSLLQRRIAFLDSMSELLHYWHVFHKPFAYVMLIIMVVHVGVTVAFGYKWIF
jgi:hypothetical protein